MQRGILAKARAVITAAGLVACTSAAMAQWNTPTINGTIAAGEYGDHTNGANRYDTGGASWYLTWNDTDLFIGAVGGNVGEAIVFYLDTDPQAPVDGGTDANGAGAGFNSYDGTSFAELQFRADAVIYARNTYREYRLDNGAGGWGSPTTGFGSFGDNGSNTREVRFPWSAVGGRPASFNFTCYLVSNTGFAFGTCPAENPGGFIGTAARWERYFPVANTANGTSIRPFSRNSYVFNLAADNLTFGAIDVWDFTMNTSGRVIGRANGAGGGWRVRNTLRITNGSVTFQGSTDDAFIGDYDLSPTGPGLGNLVVEGTGSLALSTSGDSDVILEGDLTKTGTGTTFGGDSTTSHHEVRLIGDRSVTITLPAPSEIDILEINKVGGATLTLASDLIVGDILRMVSGDIHTGANTLRFVMGFEDSGITGVQRTAGIVYGTMQRRIGGGVGTFTGSRLFPLGTATGEYTPLTINLTTQSSTQGSITVAVTDSKHPNADATGINSISRHWTITPENLTGTVATLTFQYVDEDVAAGTPFVENDNMVAARWNGTTWDDGGGNTPASVANNAANTVQLPGVVSFSPWTVFERNQTPLAVELTSFTASASAPGEPVALAWETAAELDTAGFRVRRGAPDGPAVGGLVPARGSAVGGARYSLADESALAPGESRLYYLEEIELDGSSTWHGPVKATAPSGASSVAGWLAY